MANNKNEEIYNASGCIDTTAYKAIKNIKKEERRELIMKLKDLANQHGYDIINIIRLKELETLEIVPEKSHSEKNYEK